MGGVIRREGEELLKLNNNVGMRTSGEQSQKTLRCTAARLGVFTKPVHSPGKATVYV